MNWEEDSLRFIDGKLTRWRTNVGELGDLTVEHHHNCSPRATIKCPRGWNMSTSWGGHEEVRLKAKNADGAKTEAINRVRKQLQAVVKGLT